MMMSSGAKEACENIRKATDEFAINVKDLMYECGQHEAIHTRPYTNYNNMDSDDLNSMSTYNGLRYLYREEYDIRSKGKIDFNNPGNISGREINPFTNNEMTINYFNDFSISPLFSPNEHNDFVYSITNIHKKNSYPFISKNGYYHDISRKRIVDFFYRETKPKKSIDHTSDFFSYNTQVNPLLYAYTAIDEDNQYRTMDGDYFLENGLYKKYANESFIMKGNQSSIRFWLDVTDTNYNRTNIFDDDGNEIGYSDEYTNKEWLFKDDYTRELLFVLQNPNKYFKFYKQNDYTEDPRIIKEDNLVRNTIGDTVFECDSRNTLFYDVLLNVVFRRMKRAIENDEGVNSEAINKYNKLCRLLTESVRMRNKMEFDGFPMDQYLSLNTYSQYRSEDQELMDKYKNSLGDYLLSTYRANYNVVFGQLFRILPFILSPQYGLDIQSPALSILLTSFTIMAIKNAYYDRIDEKKTYDGIIDKITELTYYIGDANLNKSNVYDQFQNIFNTQFFSKYLKDTLWRILPILIKNTTAVNYNKDIDPDDIDTYFMDQGSICEVDNEKIHHEMDKERILMNDKVFILLTEFIKKVEKLRYFDASTFCIDYTIFDKQEDRYAAKLFSDSLLESCYIHMNTLGSEVFFNGKAPGHLYGGIMNNICKTNNYCDVIGLDDTRVAKTNLTLLKDMQSESDFDKNNSYHSYMAVINLFVSLSYCIRITVDNLTVNAYNYGPYNNSFIRRPQSVWAITKRYALHMTYMNHNQYGIYNDVKTSNNNSIDIQSIMAAQRIKWLTYGLHLRVWFNDNYFFYTNYKRLMLDYKNVQTVINNISNMYETHTSGITEEFPLFRSINEKITIAAPNIGLGLAPIAGSHTITAIAALLNIYCGNGGLKYWPNNIVNLLHHGFKDIMVGDSMCSILGDRLKSVMNFLKKKNISYNNLNRKFSRAFYLLNECRYHELAIGSNLTILFKNVIAPHFRNNPNDILILNSVSDDNTYDESFFKEENIENSGFEIAYKHTWCERILKNALKNNNKNTYMGLINRLINLYKVSVANYKVCFNKDDAIINKYWSRTIGLTTQTGHLKHDFGKGMIKLIRSADKYGVFSNVLNPLFFGNRRECIGNMLTYTRSLVGFSDIVVNRAASGSIYCMYESPMMLIIYNNVPFNYTDITPPLSNLFLFSKNLFTRLHSIIKRMIVDLNYNGDPIERDRSFHPIFNIDTLKRRFVDESIEFQNMIIDFGHYSENNSELFAKIKQQGDLYKFATIIAQFMDYDFICSEVCKILNNRYDINKCEQIINNMIENRGEDYNQYVRYCHVMDDNYNQLCAIIKTMIEEKQGSITKMESIEITKPDIEKDLNEFEKVYEEIKNSNTNSYQQDFEDTTNINVKVENKNVLKYITMNTLGITLEDYNKMKEKEKREYDEQVEAAKQRDIEDENEYIKKITEMEYELSQLRRAHKLSKGIKTRELKYNPETMTDVVTREANLRMGGGKFEVMLMKLLVEIKNSLETMNDTIKDLNINIKEMKNDIIDIKSSILTLSTSNTTISTNNITTIVDKKEEDIVPTIINNNITENIESDLNSKDNTIISNNNTSITTTNDIIDNNNIIEETEKEEIIEEEIEKIDDVEVIDNVDNDAIIIVNSENDINFINEVSKININGVHMPKINDDKSITFYNNKNESITIKQDLSPSPMLDKLFKTYKSPENHSPKDYNYDNLSDEPYILSDEPAKYNDDIFFIPRKYLLRVVPYNGVISDNSSDKVTIDLNQLDDIDREIVRKAEIRKKEKGLITDSSLISIYKVMQQKVPIYNVNLLELYLPFDNIVINFNQKIKYIIKDIEERIIPMNPLYGEDIIKYIRKINQINHIFDNYDNLALSHKDRAYFMTSFLKGCCYNEHYHCRDSFVN